MLTFSGISAFLFCFPFRWTHIREADTKELQTTLECQVC
jgi:hypothetical protein